MKKVDIKFRVRAWRQYISDEKRSLAVLTEDSWNDYGLYTLFKLDFYDNNGKLYEIGYVKIGKMNADSNTTKLDREFTFLSKDYFSLGQDEDYYEKLYSLGEDVKGAILAALNDIAANTEIYKMAIDEPVTKNSLLRSVSPLTVQGQFRRLITGLPRLTDYRFNYTLSKRPKSSNPFCRIRFTVKYDRSPPSNIHVIIGSNGVGKSKLLHEMSQAYITQVFESSTDNDSEVEKDDNSKRQGYFRDESDNDNQQIFAGLVYVSFSAFDEYTPLAHQQLSKAEIRYAYIGLKRPENAGKYANWPKSSEMLSEEFAKSLFFCSRGVKSRLWQRIISFLNTDPIFSEMNPIALLEHQELSTPLFENTAKGATKDGIPKAFLKEAKSFFQRLSSGHKIVLLTLTRLVEVVEERTLVLMDEPETHLHPPLLSAFIRALSALLVDRNGVAIIATHSPVVLQEVPKRCVWVMNRFGDELRVERPIRETFGENVGVLTRDIFRLQVTQSGFHQLLSDTINEVKSSKVKVDNLYEDVVEKFREELGDEAKSIVRALTYYSEED